MFTEKNRTQSLGKAVLQERYERDWIPVLNKPNLYMTKEDVEQLGFKRRSNESEFEFRRRVVDTLDQRKADIRKIYEELMNEE